MRVSQIEIAEARVDSVHGQGSERLESVLQRAREEHVHMGSWTGADGLVAWSGQSSRRVVGGSLLPCALHYPLSLPRFVM